ncbi:MAG: DUF3105 domain-containing protein [Propionibacteriales bacterium]|nr:DUF3105 domain-containing protein [Propionibacteriales bacterium]
MSLTRVLVALVGAGLAVSACSAASDDGSGADAGRSHDLTTVDGTSTPADRGGCGDEVDNAAAEASHVETGTEMSYDGVPPVSGAHWSQYPDLSKPVYSADDRPQLGELIHSQEHGWTVVWYDDSITTSDGEMARLSKVADDVAAADPVKVVFVPWTANDGAAFPDRAHIAITHWGVSGGGSENRQFCAEPNAEAILAFVARHPYTDSSEPDAP